ncbi:enoyl hydratase, putative [Babesia ovis]|uniref:Enoyl hydratase, putative n=1 Tax=Babesia ovis TaxID=5869 RepID=A0A9W5WW98_BABOV|nr:enoyl hydratase, putative [Babesia ovis]
MSDPPSLDANGHEERLWTPIDPSGILRDCSMVCENGIHSQLVLNKGSLPGSCISCNTARYGRDRLDVVSTGERLKFHKGAGGICDQLVDAEIETTKGDPVGRKTGVTVLSAIEKTENDKQTVTVQNDGNSDADKVPSDVAGSSDRNITDNLTKKHDTNNDLKRLEYWNARTQINERSGDPYADAARFDKSQIAEFADPDVEPLLQHLTNELKRLPLRRNDCDVCRRISLLTADSATGQRIVKQNIPCSHSLGLKHAPLPQSLSTESISKHAALGTEVEVYANDGSVKRKQDATEQLPRRPTIYVDAVYASSDIDHVVETLLTYRQEEVHGQGYALCTTPKHDVEKLKERTVPGALRLEELDTALLQHVASRIPAKSGTTVDVVSAVKEVTKIQRTDYESQFGFDRCVSLTGTVVDPYASKTQRWICPQEFKVPGYLGRDTPRISIRTSIRESINDSFGDDATSAEPSRAVSIDDLYDARGLAPMTGSRNKDLNDDEYYDSDMTLDELMAKFVKLRKKPDCVASILRTLKHLICSRLQKERIYLRKRSGSENDTDRHVSADNMMLVTLRRVLETVQVAELPHNSLEESSKPVLPRDDDASVYTYSSISISSYFSEHESVCLPVDDREIARGWNLNLHKRVVEFYGIITVVDENKTQIVPNNCSTVYAELVGDDLSIYDIGGTFNSNGITVESDPLVVLHLDASFTCARPRKMKRSNESVIRINAGNYVAHGVPSSNSPSDDSGVFLRLAAEHADVSRWWMAIISRLKVSSYMELLENEHRFHLSSTNLDLVNYPNLREADLSGMQFDSLLEQRIVKTYVNTPVRYLNASHRTLKDSDLIDFCAIWNFPIKTIELSHNAFLFAENQDVFIDFIKNTKVLRLYLDGNRVSAPFLQRLPELLTDGSLRYLSLRGCIVDESVKQSLTLLNRSLGLSDKVVVDVTDIVASEEILHFLRAHPFSRLKVVTDNSQLLLPERLLEKFMDVHSKESISSMGYTCSGRLISARESKLKAPGNEI